MATDETESNADNLPLAASPEGPGTKAAAVAAAVEARDLSVLTSEEIYSEACPADDEEEEICEEPPCPTCIPDENQPVPNWKSKISPFLNKRTCNYQVTWWTDYKLSDWLEISESETAQSWTKTEDEMFEEWLDAVRESAKNDGLAKLIEYYGKSLEWPGPPPLCYPEGTVPQEGGIAVDEYGCNRLGGGTIFKAGEALETEVGQIYRDINGEVLTEPPSQAQESVSWAGIKYYWDSIKFSEDMYETEHLLEDASEGDFDSSHPHGWYTEDEFWSVEEPSVDPDIASSWTVRQLTDVINNGIDGAPFRDMYDTSTVVGQYHDYRRADTNGDGYGDGDYQDWYTSGFLLALVSANPLRIDPQGNLYIQHYPESNAIQYTPISSSKWIKFITWMGDRELGLTDTAGYDYWDDWYTFTLELIEESQEETEVATEEEEEGLDIETEWEYIDQEEVPESKTGPSSLEQWLDANVDSGWQAWKTDVEASETGQYLLNNDHVSVLKPWHQTGIDGRIKVVIAIDSEIFEQVPEIPPGEDQPYSIIEELETSGESIKLPYEVEFTTEEIADGMITRVRWLLRHFGNKKLAMAYEEDGTCLIETFKDTGVASVDDLSTEDDSNSLTPGNKMDAWNSWIANLRGEQPSPYPRVYSSEAIMIQQENLKAFKNALLDFLNENIDGYHGFSYLAEHNKRSGIENIKIKFTSTFQIEEVTYNLRSCPPVTLTNKERYKQLLDERNDAIEAGDYIWNPFRNPEFKIAKGWSEFAYKYPQTDPRTMAYIASLPYMNDVAVATTPMEWQDFMTLWTYPRVEVANFNDLRDNGMPCVSVSSAAEGILKTGVDVFINTLTKKFDQQLCKSIEAGADAKTLYWRRIDAKADRAAEALAAAAGGEPGTPETEEEPSNGGQFVRDVQLATQAAIRESLADDPMLKNIIDNIDSVRSIDGLWSTILGQLNWCGLLGFLETLFACLFQGVEFDEIMEQALISALQKMDMNLFKRLLVGLPPHVQNQIGEAATAGLSDNLKDWRPWDKEPSEETQMRNAENLKQAALDYHNARLEEQIESGDLDGDGVSETPEDIAAAEAYSAQSVDIRTAFTQQIEEAAEQQLASASALLDYDYQGYDETKHTKTLGSVLVDSGALDEVKDAYITELMNFMAPEELLEMLENIPGFTFLTELLDLTNCPGVSLFHPPLKGWFNDLSKALDEWDMGLVFWCTKPLYIPELALNRPFLLWDRLKAIAKLLLAAIEAAIIEAMKVIIKMIIDWIMDLLCSMMGTMGAAALTAVGVMDAGEFNSFIKDALCGSNASDEEIQQALGTIVSALGAASATTEEELTDLGREFISATGDMVERMPSIYVLEILSGEGSYAALRAAADFYETSGTRFAQSLGSVQAVRTTFGTLGQTFIGAGAIDKLKEAYLEQLKCVNDAGQEIVPFCSLSAGRDAIKDAFGELGLPDTATSSMADEAVSDLDDAIASAIQVAVSNGDISQMPGFPTGSMDSCNPADPGSIIPRDDEATLAAAAQHILMDTAILRTQYEAELNSDGGLFDRILSDKDGSGKSSHDRRLERLLRKHIAGNPTGIATYLRDIMKGEREDITAGSIAADSTVIDYGGTFKYIEFDPINGVGHGALDGGWSYSWGNSLETYNGEKVYAWSYGDVATDTYEYRSELSKSELDGFTDDDGNSAIYREWDASKAYEPDTGTGEPPRLADPDAVLYRKYITEKPDKWYFYPAPDARMEFLGTDPSKGKYSSRDAGQPAFHFHYWHEERHEQEEAPPESASGTPLSPYYLSDEELMKDIATLHIFKLVPNEAGFPDSHDDFAAYEVGEYTHRYRKARGFSFMEDRAYGNIETEFNGFGPQQDGPGKSRSKTALDPFIRVVRSLDDEIIEYISSMELEMISGKKQKPTIWATSIIDRLVEAIGESGDTDTGTVDTTSLYDKLYEEDYTALCNSFVQQYSAQITDDDDAWESGLLNFEMIELTEQECIELGISKYKGDDSDKKEISLPRRRKMKNRAEYPYRETNAADTGWYRPQPAPGYEGLAENVDLPQDEYGLAAYYIHQQYQRGWARVADEYLPGPGNPCEEQMSKDIFDWADISDYRTESRRQMEDDPRISSDPSCVWDPPFDRVNTRDAKAGLESYIKAVMRITVHENLIKALPAFKKFNAAAGCYGDLLTAYLYTNMREDIFQHSRRRRVFGSRGRVQWGHRRYDYKFLEQCCNMYVRAVARGEIEATTETLDAIEKIDSINEKIYYQPHGDWFKAKRKAARRKVWEYCEPYTKVVAQELFQNEFQHATEKFSKWSCAEVDNLQLHFISGSMNINNAPTSCTLTDVAVDLQENRFGLEGSYSGEYAYLENGGFVLEKYIRIHDTDDVDTFLLTAISREDHLYGIVNLDEWNSWLSDQSYEDNKISDHFAGWSYGLRLSYIPSFHGDSALESVCAEISDEVSLKHKAFNLEQIPREKGDDITTPASQPVNLIPITSTEIEIPTDLFLGDFDVVENYDIECLMSQLLEEVEFRTLFEYVFPLDRFLSLPTIYMMHTFLHSIGLDDDWYQDGEATDEDLDPWEGGAIMSWMRQRQHREGGPGLKSGDWWKFTPGLKKLTSFRNWDKRAFPKTKESLSDLFMSEYDFRSKLFRRWKMPTFSINFNFPPFGINFGRGWFANRRYPGPDCDDEPGRFALLAAYNRG